MGRRVTRAVATKAGKRTGQLVKVQPGFRIGGKGRKGGTFVPTGRTKTIARTGVFKKKK